MAMMATDAIAADIWLQQLCVLGLQWQKVTG